VSPLDDLLPQRAAWPNRPTDAELQKLPAAPAVYAWLTTGGEVVQIATTQNLRSAAQVRLLSTPDGPRADLTEIVRAAAWRTTAAALESRYWHLMLARRVHPQTYREMLAFEPAWFLRAEFTGAAPQFSLSTAPWTDAGRYVGPWPSRRKAGEALDALVDLFDLCRYPEQVRKLPRGTRCAYADMGRCDAPCDGSTPPDDYRARCECAWRLACGEVEPTVADFMQRMRSAAERQEFELAARLKGQIAIARAWAAAGPFAVPLERMQFVISLPIPRRGSRKLMAFARGRFIDGPVLPPRKFASQATAWIATARPTDAPPADANEQTALLSHFLYGSELAAAVVAPWHDAPESIAAVLELP
jgi:DNA polymerase III subunit epsilon